MRNVHPKRFKVCPQTSGWMGRWVTFYPQASYEACGAYGLNEVSSCMS